MIPRSEEGKVLFRRGCRRWFRDHVNERLMSTKMWVPGHRKEMNGFVGIADDESGIAPQRWESWGIREERIPIILPVHQSYIHVFERQRTPIKDKNSSRSQEKLLLNPKNAHEAFQNLARNSLMKMQETIFVNLEIPPPEMCKEVASFHDSHV